MSPGPRDRRRRRAVAIAVLPALVAGLHLAAIATAPTPAPPRVAVIVTPPATSSPPPGPASGSPPASTAAPPPPPATQTPAPDALLRTFVGVAVNEAHPYVILAWSHREVALTIDDGATWRRWPFPGTDATVPPVGTVTGRGVGLLSLGFNGWLEVRADGVESIHPLFGGVVTTFASDARRTVALMKEPDDVIRTVVSVDGGATWRGAPDAPQGAYDVALLPGGRVAVPYAWSASCGGGAEGVMTWRPGEKEWAAEEQPHVGHLTPDLHVVSAGCGETADVLCAWPPGADAAPVLGPRSAGGTGSTAWFASGHGTTHVGEGPTVLRLEAGGFRVVDRAAPSSLSGVMVDGRGRLVGLANGHVVRWTPSTGGGADDAVGPAGRWDVHLP